MISTGFEEDSDLGEYESSALDIEFFVNGENRIYAIENSFSRDTH